MLRIMRQGSRWITAIAIVFVGGVFVFAMAGTPSNSISPGAVLEVDGEAFGQRELGRVMTQLEDFYSGVYGDDFDAKEALLQESAIAQLIRQSVLASEARRLGLRVSDEEMKKLVRQIAPDRETFRNFVTSEYGTEKFFRRAVELDLLARKMQRLLSTSAFVSDAEVRDALRAKREEVKLAYVALDPTSLAESVDPGALELEQYAIDHAEQVAKIYDERTDRYHEPEQVRARHVLLRVAADAEPEEEALVEARAQAALERIRGGEDFAAVAKEVSDDPGSKDRGGDLGLFPRGRMTQAFEDAAFSLADGEVSELIRTEFGYHIIRVEEHRAEKTRTLEEVETEIAREIMLEESGSARVDELVLTLGNAIREGTSLEDAARAEAVNIERTDGVRRRRDGFIPGLGASRDVLTTAFALEPGASSDEVFDVASKKVFIQVTDRTEPELEALEAELDAERERLLNTKREQLQTEWVQLRRRELEDAGKIVYDLSRL